MAKILVFRALPSIHFFFHCDLALPTLFAQMAPGQLVSDFSTLNPMDTLVLILSDFLTILWSTLAFSLIPLLLPKIPCFSSFSSDLYSHFPFLWTSFLAPSLFAYISFCINNNAPPLYLNNSYLASVLSSVITSLGKPSLPPYSPNLAPVQLGAAR